MENHNAETVKKALECHISGKLANCECCFFNKVNFNQTCVQALCESALALINSQEQRIKELAEENERLMEELEKACKVNFYCSFTKSKIQNCPIDDEVAKAKTDTVRKMQERLKKQRFSDASPHDYELLHCFIDGVAEEMLEVSNG